MKRWQTIVALETSPSNLLAVIAVSRLIQGGIRSLYRESHLDFFEEVAEYRLGARTVERAEEGEPC